MSYSIVATVAVVGFTLIALVREWAPAALIVSTAAVVLLLGGVITPTEALAGFSNPAPATVAALFVVARAVERTGVLRSLMALAVRPDGSERANLLRLLVPSAAASAFLNNTPIVAMLIGPVSASAEAHGRSPSRLLMPLSFAVLLGGMTTLIGTSTNLVVSGLLADAGEAPLGLFEFTPLGGPVALLGIGALLLLAPTLLPLRRSLRERFGDEQREFTIEMEVHPDGPLVGKTVADARLRHLQGVFLSWVRRGEAILAPIAPDLVLTGGDRLGFVGRVEEVMDLQAMPGLRVGAHKHVRGIDVGEHRFVEVVLASISPLVGTTLKVSGFREQYQATVLAIHRAGERLTGKLGDIPLAAGDTLLLLAESGFANRWRDRRDFLLVAERNGAMPVSSRKAWIVFLVTTLMMLTAALEWIPILQGALAAALLCVLARTITPHEARSAVDLDVILLIAASFGIGAAIETSGLASLVAGWVVEPAMQIGPVAVLAAIVFGTMLLTELITNNAAAVLMFPIAAAAAVQSGMEVRPFAIAVALAASASFLTPIGYQTNTMVFGPGGYRFGDYWRLGLPLSLLVGAGIVALTVLQW